VKLTICVWYREAAPQSVESYVEDFDVSLGIWYDQVLTQEWGIHFGIRELVQEGRQLCVDI
jgi:hypothetical protein